MTLHSWCKRTFTNVFSGIRTAKKRPIVLHDIQLWLFIIHLLLIHHVAAPVIAIDKCVDTEATIRRSCLNLTWTNNVWVCDRVTFYSTNFCNRIWIIEGERKWSVSTWNLTTHDVHTDVSVNLLSFAHLALSVFCDVTPYCSVCFPTWLFCFELICPLVIASSSWPPLFSLLSALHASSLPRAAFSPPPPPSWHERITLNRKWLRAIESIPNRKSVYSVRKKKCWAKWTNSY